MSRPVKRSLTLRGHRTSVSLEDPFWQAFREIAGPMMRTRRQAIAALQEKKLEAARKKRKRDA